MKIILTGFMGSGKSSVAKALAARLAQPLIEMDELVFIKTGCNDMQEVFAKGGESLLRETEVVLAKEYQHQDNVVISTGGGVGVNKTILDLLREKNGKVFFLEASFDVIIQRLEHCNKRPLFQDCEKAKALYDFRLPLYIEYADIVINVDNKTIDSIVAEININS